MPATLPMIPRRPRRPPCMPDVPAPPVVDTATWEAALAELREREKPPPRELDAIAAARRRLPMVELPDYTLVGADGPVRLVDVFDGRGQLSTYHRKSAD